MKWNKEAEKALGRVPFFVRKRVKKRVEDEARSMGAAVVDMGHMNTCRNRFLTKMEQEVKGVWLRHLFWCRRVSQSGLPLGRPAGQYGKSPEGKRSQIVSKAESRRPVETAP